MQRKDPEPRSERHETEVPATPSADKKPWEEPKLAYVTPKLTRHGSLEKITGGRRRRRGFFGEFSP
jgi:hypothetical protein